MIRVEVSQTPLRNPPYGMSHGLVHGLFHGTQAE